MAESKKEYKARVLEAKKIVEQMFINGQKKEFSLTKIEKDVKNYLDSQGLTKFDLRTNGDRKNQAMFQAFTNSANKGIMEILQVILPEVASSLDLKQFMLFGEEALDRNDEVKKAWEEEVAESSAADPLFAEVHKSYSDFRKKYAIWGDRAYLK